MRLAPIYILFLVILAGAAAAQDDEYFNVRQVGHISYPFCSDIWGYTDSSGIDFALVGLYDGMAVVDVGSNPARPTQTGFIPGTPSDWRDLKTWGHYAYVTNESSGGLDIIDLDDPWNPTLAGHYDSTFASAHNLFIADGYAYIVGSNTGPGGIHILDLSNPTQPVEVGSWEGAYVHDLFVRGDTVYASAYGDEKVYILDAGNKASLTILAEVTGIPASHACWVTEDSKYLISASETSGGHVQIYDIQDLQNMFQVSSFEVGENKSVHNVFVRDSLLIISYYVYGTRVVDISDPANPVEVGYYDFYPGDGGVFAGNWGTYPYSSSGLIYSSSMSGSGMHVLEYPSPVDIRHTPPRDSENLTDPFTFTIQLFQMTHTPLDLATLAIISGLDGDFADSTTLTPLAVPEDYLASIPNPGAAGQLRYYFRVNDLEGNVITEPYGAPNAWFSFNVGPDQVPPEIHYVTSAEGQGSIRTSGEFPVTAVVSDNIAIDEVHLLYSVDGAPEVDLLMARTGIITEYQYPDVLYLYETTLTWEDVSLPASIEYYVVCIDSTSQQNQVVFSTNILELGAYELVDDFENGLDKWSLGQGWGESVFGAGTSLAAHDSPAGNYPDNSSNSLTLSRPYDLSPFESAILSFSHMYLVWLNQDSCLVELSKDSLAWEVVAAYTGWQLFHVPDSIDISPWTGPGAETVFIRFTIKSDSTQTADGWHLDNIEILVQLPLTGTSSDGGTNPTTYRLAQNYPNPFNPSTTIRFELPEAVDISIVVYDLMGREIERLVDGHIDPGYHQVIWDGRDRRGRKVPTGIYIARLLATPTSPSAGPTAGATAEYSRSIKMLLLK